MQFRLGHQLVLCLMYKMACSPAAARSEREVRSENKGLLLKCWYLWFLLWVLADSGARALTPSKTYYTPPSPWLDNHRLAFTIPGDWQLVKVTSTEDQPVTLSIASNGQIQNHPYWDTGGLLCVIRRTARQPALHLLLWVMSSWYVQHGLELAAFLQHPFTTASGLKGWWISNGHHRNSIQLSGFYLSCLLNVDIPANQGVFVNLDHSYAPSVVLGFQEPYRTFGDILHPPTFQELALLKAIGRSLRINPVSYPPPSWLPQLPRSPVIGRFYYTPPVGSWLGRQVRLTIPKGWYVAKDQPTDPLPSPPPTLAGWFKRAPNLIISPAVKGSSHRCIRLSFWIADAEYQSRGAFTYLAYPFQTQTGLHGFLDFTNGLLSVLLYIPQVDLGGRYEADTLQLSCQLPQAPKLAAALRPIALAILSSVTVVPPSKQTTKPNLPFDPAFLYDITFDQPFHPNPLLYATNGRLYASATFHRSQNPGFLFSLSPNGTGFRILHSFAPLQPDFSNQDGAFPFAPLAQDAHQHLYGTTSTGGPACDGTLFTLAPDGSHFHLLHAFSGPDGALPYAGPLPSKNGWLYGVTDEGGPYGKGVVYRIREDGTGFQVLHSFGGKDGAYPLLVELVEGEGGWLYGVTSGGGVYGNGVVFGVKEDGSGYRVLHEFSAEDGLGRNGDGSHPYGGLVLGLGGWLYGETYGGGGYGVGVVFSVREDGSGYRVLHTFKGGVEGSHAVGSLLLWGEKLYGVCSEGGSLGGGCVFVLGVVGEGYRVLHSFGVDREGWTGLGGLVLLGSGWLYGVTEGGGVGGEGVVYRLRADGSGFGVVYDFGKRLRQAVRR